MYLHILEKKYPGHMYTERELMLISFPLIKRFDHYFKHLHTPSPPPPFNTSLSLPCPNSRQQQGYLPVVDILHQTVILKRTDWKIEHRRPVQHPLLWLPLHHHHQHHRRGQQDRCDRRRRLRRKWKVWISTVPRVRRTPSRISYSMSMTTTMMTTTRT